MSHAAAKAGRAMAVKSPIEWRSMVHGVDQRASIKLAMCYLSFCGKGEGQEVRECLDLRRTLNSMKLFNIFKWMRSRKIAHYQNLCLWARTHPSQRLSLQDRVIMHQLMKINSHSRAAAPRGMPFHTETKTTRECSQLKWRAVAKFSATTQSEQKDWFSHFKVPIWFIMSQQQPK